MKQIQFLFGPAHLQTPQLAGVGQMVLGDFNTKEAGTSGSQAKRIDHFKLLIANGSSNHV